MYPAQGPASEKLTIWAIENPITYIHTTNRGEDAGAARAVAWVRERRIAHAPPSRKRPIEGIGARMTIYEALEVGHPLVEKPVRVIDAHSISSIDRETIKGAAVETPHMTAVDGHGTWTVGGLGDAGPEVVACLAARLTKPDTTGWPGPASPSRQLHLAGISARSMADVIRNIP